MNGKLTKTQRVLMESSEGIDWIMQRILLFHNRTSRLVKCHDRLPTLKKKNIDPEAISAAAGLILGEIEKL